MNSKKNENQKNENHKSIENQKNESLKTDEIKIEQTQNTILIKKGSSTLLQKLSINGKTFRLFNYKGQEVPFDICYGPKRFDVGLKTEGFDEYTFSITTDRVGQDEISIDFTDTDGDRKSFLNEEYALRYSSQYQLVTPLIKKKDSFYYDNNELCLENDSKTITGYYYNGKKMFVKTADKIDVFYTNGQQAAVFSMENDCLKSIMMYTEDGKQLWKETFLDGKLIDCQYLNGSKS